MRVRKYLIFYRKLLCPVNEKNHFVKLKELVSLNLKNSKSESEAFLCCVCHKELSFQKIIALKKCGHVMCKVNLNIY